VVLMPLEPARSLGQRGVHSSANHKKWNGGVALLHLDWHKNVDGRWCRFDDVDSGLLQGAGVFVIWKNGNGVQVSAVLYVGRGLLRDEYLRCRRDPLFYRSESLYVTWTTVSTQALDPVAAYLYQNLRPIWGEVVPSVPPTPVNLPVSA
jgi:hypothetical protein